MKREESDRQAHFAMSAVLGVSGDMLLTNWLLVIMKEISNNQLLGSDVGDGVEGCPGMKVPIGNPVAMINGNEMSLEARASAGRFASNTSDCRRQSSSHRHMSKGWNYGQNNNEESKSQIAVFLTPERALSTASNIFNDLLA